MMWFKGVLTFLVVAVCAVQGFRLRRGERDDIVHCPPGTSATAMTMGISSSGPSGWSNRSAITLCLMCTAPGVMSMDDDDDRDGASQFTQEVCTYYGDSNRVMTQKFECTNNELMRGISKDNSSLDSFLSCSKVDKAEENSVYETSFPPRSNRVARRNWQNWKMNVTCEDYYRRFMCGVRMVAPGAGKDYESHPKLDPICCTSYQAYNRFNSSIYEYTIGSPDHGPDYRTGSGSGAAVGILTFLVLLLLAGVILLVIHMFFCPILPASCVNSMQSYGQSKLNGAAASNGAPSTFNSRPATAAAANGTSANGTNGTAANGSNGLNGFSRPQTSTRRTSVVKPATNTG